MNTVNGYYLVKTENLEQKSAGIFVAMSNESKFVKCEVLEVPQDGTGVDTNPLISGSQKFVYTFKDKLTEISLDGKNFFLLKAEDIVATDIE